MAVLRDVRETVLDGQLGFSGRSGSGISVRIGPSPIVSDKLIIITGDMTADTIKERLGRSPLADSVMDSVQFGAARVYCLPLRRAPLRRWRKRARAAARSRRPAAPITPSRWW